MSCSARPVISAAQAGSRLFRCCSRRSGQSV